MSQTTFKASLVNIIIFEKKAETINTPYFNALKTLNGLVGRGGTTVRAEVEPVYQKLVANVRV